MSEHNLANAWLKYRGRFSISLSFADEESLRKAFYSGASTLLFTMMDALSTSPEPTEDEVDFLADVRTELLEFETQTTIVQFPKRALN